MGQVSRTILSLHKRSGGVLRLKPPFFSSVTMLLSTNPTPNVFRGTCLGNPILIQPFRYVAPAYIAPAPNAIAYIAPAYIAPTYIAHAP